MKFQTNKENPCIRFYEFVETLSEGKLADLISNLESGVSVNSFDYSVKSPKEKGILKTSSISNGVFFPSENKKILDKDLVRAKRLVKAETIIVSRMNTPLLVGEIGFVPSDFDNLYLPDRLWSAEIKNGHNVKWLSYYLISPKVKRVLKNIATGTSGSMKNISKPHFLKISIFFPQEIEQQKIANFLSSVDKKIQQLTEKQLLLQQYKKGIMQKLFSQEIRFKDEQGNDFPDWEEKVVGDFMKESRVKGSSGDKAKKITVKLWGKGVYEKNEKNSGSENTQYYIRKSGQFIYSKLDFLNCAFGVIPEYLDKFETTVDLPCFDVEQSISKYFVLEYIKQKRFYKKYGDMADGSRKAKRIHADAFLSFPINLPSTKEQNKIESFLSALDKKIDFTRQQIEQTQTFKKGLLQQMFV